MNNSSLIRQISRAALSSSPALEKVGLWIASHPLRVISMSADEVARQAGSSLAAVNRFARSAGFEGFSHLKTALSEELQEAAEPIRKLRSNAEGGAAMQSLFGDAENNIRIAAQSVGLQAIDEAARRLLESRQVFTLGLGLGHTLASAASLLLMPFLPSVISVAGEGGTEVAARRLLHIGPQDTLISVSIPRYSNATESLARFARERSAFVIAITDKPTAPLAAHAQILLLAPATHGVISASSVATLAVIEALASRVMQLNRDSPNLATRLSEAVLDYISPSQTKASP
jgi:DNA-binding MurR/RpiR family transcriptional regulator